VIKEKESYLAVNIFFLQSIGQEHIREKNVACAQHGESYSV